MYIYIYIYIYTYIYLTHIDIPLNPITFLLISHNYGSPQHPTSPQELPGDEDELVAGRSASRGSSLREGSFAPSSQ